MDHKGAIQHCTIQQTRDMFKLEFCSDKLKKKSCMVVCISNKLWMIKPSNLTVRGHQVCVLLACLYVFYACCFFYQSYYSFLDQNKKRLRSHHCLRSASQLQQYLGSVQLRSMPQAHFCTPGPEPPQQKCFSFPLPTHHVDGEPSKTKGKDLNTSNFEQLNFLLGDVSFYHIHLPGELSRCDLQHMYATCCSQSSALLVMAFT